MLLFPATAFAWPQPPPSLNKSQSEIVIDNETPFGAWITLYKDVKVGPVGIGKQQIVGAYCAEPRKVTKHLVSIDMDVVRAEVKPDCRGQLLLDASHRTHPWSFSTGRPNQSATFRRFDGRIWVTNGAVHFQDDTR